MANVFLKNSPNWLTSMKSTDRLPESIHRLLPLTLWFGGSRTLWVSSFFEHSSFSQQEGSFSWVPPCSAQAGWQGVRFGQNYILNQQLLPNVQTLACFGRFSCFLRVLRTFIRFSPSIFSSHPAKNYIDFTWRTFVFGSDSFDLMTLRN